MWRFSTYTLSFVRKKIPVPNRHRQGRRWGSEERGSLLNFRPNSDFKLSSIDWLRDILPNMQLITFSHFLIQL